jgi:hypothetical protein
MSAEELVRDQQWSAWISVREPDMLEIPAGQAQLIGRITGDAFDGGRTARWLTGLGATAIYRSVRDVRTGHTIHCVSDRPFRELTADLHLGLRLLAWMSVRPVTWYWWDQPWVRELPALVDPGREHVNGGWAIPGILEVHVYRREEAHKVMLHETIHALSLDVPLSSVEPVRAAFDRELGRSLWPHLGEAFTEFFAEWLWSIASSRSLAGARRHWAAQLECSAAQAGRVWARIWDSREAENTNVFAYYVLKWVLMGHTGAVLLAADRSVDRWVSWWRAAAPALTALTKTQAATEGNTLRMGMTCPYGV